MKTKNLSILLAAIVLIAAQLACAVGEPTLSNVRVTSDEAGENPATTFGTFDTVYVVGDLSNAVEGNQVTTRWYTENVPGYEANSFIDESTIDIGTEPIGFVYFYFPPQADGWPTGTYKVEVYFNGVLNSTVNFTIQ